MNSDQCHVLICQGLRHVRRRLQSSQREFNTEAIKLPRALLDPMATGSTLKALNSAVNNAATAKTSRARGLSTSKGEGLWSDWLETGKAEAGCACQLDPYWEGPAREPLREELLFLVREQSLREWPWTPQPAQACWPLSHDGPLTMQPAKLYEKCKGRPCRSWKRWPISPGGIHGVLLPLPSPFLVDAFPEVDVVCFLRCGWSLTSTSSLTRFKEGVGNKWNATEGAYMYCCTALSKGRDPSADAFSVVLQASITRRHVSRSAFRHFLQSWRRGSRGAGHIELVKEILIGCFQHRIWC